jgi:hypothetical protein
MGNKGFGYKVLGFLVWRSWMRVLRHESRAARQRLRRRRIVVGAGVAVTVFAVGAAIAHSQRGAGQ